MPEKTSLDFMLNIGRVGKKNEYPKTPTVFGSADNKWKEQLSLGNISDERRARMDITQKDVNGAIVEQAKTLKDLVSSGERITKGSLDEYLSQHFMMVRGLSFVDPDGKTRGANWRNPYEFGDASNPKNTYEKWIKSVFVLLLPYQQIIDASVRTEINRIIVNDITNLDEEEQTELKSLAKGLFLVNNMNLSFMSCNGDVNAWASPEKGAIVSTDEDDRLSFDSFFEQLSYFPGMAKTIQLLDREVIREVSNENFSMSKFVSSLNSSDIGMVGKSNWEVNSQKQLALMWYRMLGFPDMRKFAYLNNIYGLLMPAGERLNKKDKKAMKAYNDATSASVFKFGYASPYYFLMDPCSMVNDILKNYPGLVADIRVRMKNDSSPHNIFNFGWMPPALHLFNKLIGKSLTLEEVNNVSLQNIYRGGIAAIPADKVKEFTQKNDGLFQKHAFKFAEKAGIARSAFLGVLNLDPKKFSDLYYTVSDFLREVDDLETHTTNNMFTRNEILPILTEAIIAGAKWANKNIKWGYNSQFKLPISPNELNFIVAQIRIRLDPVNPFTDRQVKELRNLCTAPSVFAAGLR